MPILTQTAKKTQDTSQPKLTDQVRAQPENERSVVVETRYQDRDHLLTHIEGASWRVLYYQQVMDKDSEASYQQLERHSVYQQYYQIVDFELKVTGALSQSQNDRGTEFEVTGEATLYPGIVPNKGDMFIADVGDGRDAIFAVTDSRRLTILKQSCYQIQYRLVSYVTPKRRQDLVNKTIETYHFVKSRLDRNQSPFLIENEHQAQLSLEDQFKQLLNQYFGTFYDLKIRSIKVPGQTALTHDPFLVKALLSILNHQDHAFIPKTKQYQAQIAGYPTPLTVWDVLLNHQLSQLYCVNEKLACVGSTYFSRAPQYEGVYFSQIDQIVFPIDQEYTVLGYLNLSQSELKPKDIRYHLEECDLPPIEVSEHHDALMDHRPSIHSVTLDDYYVFSEAFYHPGEEREQSQLEYLVRQSLQGQPILKSTLLKLSQFTHQWGALEQFYYIPVLLILIKLALREA